MTIGRLLALIVLLVPLSGLAEPPSSTSQAMQAFFTFEGSGPQFKRIGRAASLEICFDVCDFYSGRSVERDADLWDLAFLHQYFVNNLQLDEFRPKHTALAVPTLNAHSAGCETLAGDALARCVIDRLAAKLDVRYSFVRYDEGLRCAAAGKLTDPKTLGKFRCKALSANAP